MSKQLYRTNKSSQEIRQQMQKPTRLRIAAGTILSARNNSRSTYWNGIKLFMSCKYISTS